MSSNKISDSQLDDWLSEKPVAKITAEKSNGNSEASSSGKESDRVPCPVCKEMIRPNALKCRFCGEVIYGESDRQQVCGSGFLRDRRRATSKNTNGVAAILSFFVPGLGQICKGEFFWGLLLMIAWGNCVSVWLFGVNPIGIGSNDPEIFRTSANLAAGAFVCSAIVTILAVVNAYR